MSLNNYIQYTFQTSADIDKDTLIQILFDYEFDGFEETDNGFVAYISEEKDIHQNEWYPLLQQIDAHIRISKSIISQRNWNEEWEKNYDIVKVNDLCEIYAPFHTIHPDIQYPIFIEPKMSFGTGHHPTTFMMINLLFQLKHHLVNKNILDVGCGTGILSIVAKKLGANHVFAIDNDEICIVNTKENIQKNIPAHQWNDVYIIHGTIEVFQQQFPHKKVDMLLANIQKNIILNELPKYKEILSHTGYLLVSGILQNDEKEILHAALPLHHIQTIQKNEWISMVFQS